MKAAARTIWLSAAVGLGMGLSGCGRDAEGTWRRLQVTDLDGRDWEVTRTWGSRGSVLVFLSVECPVANRYAPEIRRIHDRFSAQGITFWMVHPNADESPDVVRRHAREYELPGVIIRDPQHRLVRLAGVRVTPEVAVVSTNGVVLYRGRIDDRHVALGTERPEPTTRDLVDVLSAMVEGRAVEPRVTTAVGCSIPEVR